MQGIEGTRGGVRRTLAFCVAAFVLPFASQAIELPAWTDDVQISVGPAGSTMSVTAAMLDANSMNTVENADGSITFMNGAMSMGGMWDWDWDNITLKPDPIVSFVGGFANASAMSQDFVLTITTPVSPQVLPSSLVGGSTSMTYGDANGDGLGGLTNSTLGGPGYRGTIDGGPALDLLVSFSLAPGFPGDTTQVAAQALGLGGASGPPLPGPAALTSIGIEHRFNLSGNDQVTFNSFFSVVPIPEPGTGVLVAIGLCAMTISRRRGA